MVFSLIISVLYRVLVDFKLEHQNAHSNGQSTYIKAWDAPRQTGNTECGYFVISYMRDIVVGGVGKLENKKSYTKEDLERVREEWVTYVQTFINCDD